MRFNTFGVLFHLFPQLFQLLIRLHIFQDIYKQIGPIPLQKGLSEFSIISDKCFFLHRVHNDSHKSTLVKGCSLLYSKGISGVIAYDSLSCMNLVRIFFSEIYIE